MLYKCVPITISINVDIYKYKCVHTNMDMCIYVDYGGAMSTPLSLLG